MKFGFDQPTMRREYRSSTTAAYNQPSAVQMYVKSATHFWYGASAWNWRSSTLSAMALRARVAAPSPPASDLPRGSPQRNLRLRENGLASLATA